MKTIIPWMTRYQAFNMLREAAWRSQRAHAIIEDSLRVSQWSDDPQTLAAVRFYRALQRCRNEDDRERLAAKWPALEAADCLASSDGPQRWEVEARILLGQNDRHIALKCALTPETVAWYEAIFFSVRDRLARGRDWIAARVIGLVGLTEVELGKIWAAFAYHGRSEALLEAVMAVTLDKPLPDWIKHSCSGNPRVFEARVRTSVKLAVSALMIPVTLPLKRFASLREQAFQVESASRQERRAGASGSITEKVLAELTGACAEVTAREGQAGVVA